MKPGATKSAGPGAPTVLALRHPITTFMVVVAWVCRGDLADFKMRQAPPVSRKPLPSKQPISGSSSSTSSCVAEAPRRPAAKSKRGSGLAGTLLPDRRRASLVVGLPYVPGSEGYGSTLNVCSYCIFCAQKLCSRIETKPKSGVQVVCRSPFPQAGAYPVLSWSSGLPLGTTDVNGVFAKLLHGGVGCSNGRRGASGRGQ